MFRVMRVVGLPQVAMRRLRGHPPFPSKGDNVMDQLSWLLTAVVSGDGADIFSGLTGRRRGWPGTAPVEQYAPCRAVLGQRLKGVGR
jgi:hypothetical protein